MCLKEDLGMKLLLFNRLIKNADMIKTLIKRNLKLLLFNRLIKKADMIKTLIKKKPETT